MARRERDGRREASLNASAKMQLILNRPEDANASVDTALPSPNLSSQGKDLPKHINGRRPTPDRPQEPYDSVPTIVVDDPISRTIDEVIARSVQLVDRLAEPVSAPVSNPAVTLTNGNRRKQTSPRQRPAALKGAPPVIPVMPSTTAVSSRKSKSKSPLISNPVVPNGPQIILPEIINAPAISHTVSSSASDVRNDANTITDTDPSAVINGVTSSDPPAITVTSGKGGHGHIHALSMIKTNERDDSPTRYFLAVPDSVDGVTEASSKVKSPSPLAPRKISPGRVVDNVKRKRSSSRTPTNIPPARTEKLASLLRKRKPPPESPRGDTPSSSGRPAVANVKSRALAQKKPKMRNGTAVEEERPTTRRRKLDAIIAKKGERTVWSWRGRSFEKTVFSEAHKCNIPRTCYHAVKHYEGEVIKVGDCVHLRAGKGQKPHVGKIAAFWDDEKGDMMMTIFWYWRPEEVETNMRPNHGEMEVYVSNLRDENHVGCIDEKCYVLTLHQYACFMASQKEDGSVYRRPKEQIVPETNSLLLDDLPDDDTDLDLVYFADKGYDGKHKRFWRYYFRGNRLRKYVSDNF